MEFSIGKKLFHLVVNPGLQNDIIMRNVNSQHVLETEIIANEPSGRRRSDGEAAAE